MSAKAGGNRTTQNSTTSVDQETADWMRQLWAAGAAAGGAGPSSLLTQSAAFGANAQGQGNLGLGALGGDSASVQRLMNPYIQNVVDQNAKGWDQINQATMNQVNDAATKAGAFGGSRHGVAEGVALANNNLAQAQQQAGLYSQGYDQAINQAGQLAGLGFQGSALNSNLGLQGVGSPQQWYLNMLKQGFIGPLGSTSSGRTNNVSGETGFKVPFFG